MTGWIGSMLRRLRFWRSSEVLRRVAKRAVDSPNRMTELSPKECKSIEEFCIEYMRRAKEAKKP